MEAAPTKAKVFNHLEDFVWFLCIAIRGLAIARQGMSGVHIPSNQRPQGNSMLAKPSAPSYLLRDNHINICICVYEVSISASPHRPTHAHQAVLLGSLKHGLL